MAWMKSPEGDEVAQVPDELVPHYVGLGGTIVGPPEEGIEADPLLDPTALIPSIPIGRAGAAIVGAVPGMLRGVGRMAGSGLGRAAGRFAVHETPVLGKLVRMAEFADEIAGKKVGANVARKGAGKLVGKTRLRPKLVAKPTPKPPAAKIMSAEEQAAARAAGRQQVTGGGKDFRRLASSGTPRVAKSQAMRGASGPELERRAAARARPQVEPEPDDLMAMLGNSLEAEKQMAAAGLSQAEKVLVRRAVMGGGGLASLLAIMGFMPPVDHNLPPPDILGTP